MALIWLRRLVMVLLTTASLFAIFGAYVLVDNLVRTAVVGGFTFMVPAFLWLDHRLTARLQRRILMPNLIDHLEGTDEQLPKE